MLDKINIRDIPTYKNSALVFQDCHYDVGLQTSKSAADAWNRIFKDQIPFMIGTNKVRTIMTIVRNDDSKRQDVLIIFDSLKQLSKSVYNTEMYYLKSVNKYLSQFKEC